MTRRFFHKKRDEIVIVAVVVDAAIDTTVKAGKEVSEQSDMWKEGEDLLRYCL